MPAKTLPELIDYARKNPDKLAYGSSGTGGHVHLATELFLDMANIKMTHAPYKGSGPAIQDTIAGNVQMVLGSAAATLPHIKSGRLRALAVTTAKRIRALPDLPTIAEAGVPGYEVTAWHGIVTPNGLPPAIATRLNKDINASLNAKELVDFLASDGLEPAGGSPERLLALIKSDMERWRAVIQKRGIKLE